MLSRDDKRIARPSGGNVVWCGVRVPDVITITALLWIATTYSPPPLEDVDFQEDWYPGFQVCDEEFMLGRWLQRNLFTNLKLMYKLITNFFFFLWLKRKRDEKLQEGHMVELWVSESSSTGKIANWTTGRLYIPSCVRTVTTLTTPSSPGWVITTRPIFHTVGGTFGRRSNTRSPTRRFACLRYHFDLPCRVLRYSADHRFQKDCCSWFNNCHRVRRLIGVDVRVRSC